MDYIIEWIFKKTDNRYSRGINGKDLPNSKNDLHNYAFSSIKIIIINI